MSYNQFSIVRTNNGWTDGRDNYTLHCDCDIASGMGHASVADALREPLHICPDTRTRPVYSGFVIAGDDTVRRQGERSSGRWQLSPHGYGGLFEGASPYGKA